MDDSRKLILTLSLVAVTLVFFFYLALGGGARLFFSPSSGTYNVGALFKVNVKIDSGGGVGINVAEGTIKFDPAYLSVVSLSTQNSIFNLWTTQPTFSNSNGTITFGGGSPQAYTGSSGNIFSITFKAKKAGATKVYFSSGSALAADGKGTEVLASKGSANFSIVASTPSKTPTPILTPTPSTNFNPPSQELSGLPSLPKIKSSTHPDPSKWYSNNKPKFSWELPPDVIAVKLLVGSRPYANPTVLYSPPIDSKELDALPDGIWYFHVRFKNNVGWGPVAHRKILIDTSSPVISALQIKKEDSTDPTPKVILKASDKPSGIGEVSFKVDDASSTEVSYQEIEEKGYKLYPQLPGKHILLVTVYDKAGNSTSSKVEFEIEPIRPPVITQIPAKIRTSQDLLIRGTSYYPDSKIIIYLSEDKKVVEQETKTDKNGNWTYLWPSKLKKGTYTVWAKVVDKRGAISNPSEKKVVKVIGVSLIQDFWWVIIITLLILLGVFVGLYSLEKKKNLEKKERVKKQLKSLKGTIEKVFIALKEELEEDIEKADGRKGVSRTEEEVKEKLKEALEVSEELINKDIKNLDEEIKEM